MSYVDVREPVTGHLLFRYDPMRRLVQIKVKAVVTTVDLEGIPPTHLPVVRTTPPAAENAAAHALPVGASTSSATDGEGHEGKDSAPDGEGKKVSQPTLVDEAGKGGSG